MKFIMLGLLLIFARAAFEKRKDKVEQYGRVILWVFCAAIVLTVFQS